MPDAIPTSYNGIDFASRLEARWAMFLENCGFDWQYEPNGEGSIPDFKIKHVTFSTLIEVKGQRPNLNYLYHLHRIGCDILAISGFYKGREPLIFTISLGGIIHPVCFQRTFDTITDRRATAFKIACDYRFDL